MCESDNELVDKVDSVAPEAFAMANKETDPTEDRDSVELTPFVTATRVNDSVMVKKEEGNRVEKMFFDRECLLKMLTLCEQNSNEYDDHDANNRDCYKDNE